MPNLFQILLLSKISDCILIVLERKNSIFRKLINSFAETFERFRLTLITVLNLEFFDMFGKSPGLYIQNLAFLNKKSSNWRTT